MASSQREIALSCKILSPFQKEIIPVAKNLLHALKGSSSEKKWCVWRCGGRASGGGEVVEMGANAD